MADRVSLPNLNFPILPDEPSRGVENKETTIVAQMLSGGTATPGIILLDVGLNTGDTLAGAGSVAAELIRKFQETNPISKVNLLPIADGGGTASTGAIVFTGTNATEAGTYTVYIGSKDTEHKAVVAVADLDDPTDIGGTLDVAISALTRSLVTSLNTTGSVAVTAKNTGTIGDNIGIIVEGEVAGITVAITAMSGGATDPSATGLEAQLGFQTDIVMPYENGIGDLQTFLDDRFNTNNNILNGILVTGLVDTKTNIVAIGALENSQSTVIFADKPIDLDTKKGNALFETPQNIAVIQQAIRTLRLEDGADISTIITSREPLDNIGGVHMSSLPYFNTLTPLNPIPINQGWSDDEVTDLNDAGISVVGNNDARNAIITGEFLTTYKTNIQGLNDPTYKFLNNVDTATAAREYMFRSAKIDYAQARLQVGNRKFTGYKVVTEAEIISDFMKYYTALSNIPFVLFEGGEIGSTGETIADKFIDALNVIIDKINGTFTVTGILPIMGQVRGINAPFSVKLDVRR